MSFVFADPEQRRAARSVDDAKRFWRGLSDFYVKTTQLDDLRTRATTETFVREARLSSTDVVLDAGAGHLRIAMALMRLVPGVQLTGVDLTQQLLDEGARRLEAQGLPPIELVCSDLARLPFGNDFFDKIVSARVFQYISDPVAVCRELARVLKPGGRLVLSVPNRLNPIKRARYQGRLYAPAELGSWLVAAGLTEVTTGSACFVPGQLRRGWDSSWLAAERLAQLPAFGLIGGNAWAAGAKRSEGSV